MTHLLLSSAVWQTIWSVAAAILLLLVMITVHELGHYLAGKIFKFGIEEFAIGFGPSLFRRKCKNGEYFSVRLFPLGGFCSFTGEDADSDNPRAFNNRKPWQRVIVLVSGALMNFILALLVIIVNFAIFGQTMLMAYEVKPDVRVHPDYSLQSGDVILEANGRNVYLASDLMAAVKGGKAGDKVNFVVLREGADGARRKERVEVVLRADADIKNLESTAALYESLGIARHIAVKESFGDLEAGDRILSIEGESVYGFDHMAEILAGRSAGEEATLEIVRANARTDVTVTLLDAGDRTGGEAAAAMLGVTGDYAGHEIYGANVKFGFFATVGRSFAYAFRIAGSVFVVLGQLLTGKLGVSSLGGPVTTVAMTSKMVAMGWNAFFEIAAFIGVNLAVFNLLPIPALDGSRVVFTLIEWARGKPVSRKIEAVIHFAGFLVLIGFSLLVDLLQLF